MWCPSWVLERTTQAWKLEGENLGMSGLTRERVERWGKSELEPLQELMEVWTGDKEEREEGPE